MEYHLAQTHPLYNFTGKVRFRQAKLVFKDLPAYAKTLLMIVPHPLTPSPNSKDRGNP
jgi:hypothetical protein